MKYSVPGDTAKMRQSWGSHPSSLQAQRRLDHILSMGLWGGSATAGFSNETTRSLISY